MTHRRRRFRIVRPSLQWRLILSFAGISALALLLQYILPDPILRAVVQHPKLYPLTEGEEALALPDLPGGPPSAPLVVDGAQHGEGGRRLLVEGKGLGGGILGGISEASPR